MSSTRISLRASVEGVSAGSVTASFPLPALVHGQHNMTIPRGIPFGNDPYTFTCNLPQSSYRGATEPAEYLWDNRNKDSVHARFPLEDDASIYGYQPAPPREESFISCEVVETVPGSVDCRCDGLSLALTAFGRPRISLATGLVSPQKFVLLGAPA